MEEIEGFEFTDEHETDVGLPNTCCICGKPPGKTWYARNRDEARSGLGVCKKCAFPPKKKAEQEPEQAEE
jgi:hypothetical protein